MKKVWAAITTLAVLAVVILGGTFSGLQFGFRVTVADASCERSSEAGTVILDSSSERVVLLNKNGKCIKIFTPDTGTDQAACFSAVDITDDAVYIAGYTCYEDSPYIKEESLVRYDLHGNVLNTVFTIEHSMGEDRTQVAYINDLIVDGGTGEAALLNVLEQRLFIYSFDVCSAGLCPTTDDPAVRELPQAFPDGNLYETYFAENDPAVIIARSADDRFAYAAYMDTEPAFIAAASEIPAVSVVSLSLENGSMVTAAYACPSEGLSFAYPAGSIVSASVFLLCCLWLAVTAIALAVRGIVFWVKKRELRKLRILAVSTLAVLACGFITTFYSVTLMKNLAAERDEALQGYTMVLYSAVQDELEECISDFRDDGILDADRQLQMERLLEQNSMNMAEIGQYVIFTLDVRGDDGGVYDIGDSTLCCMAGYDIGSSLDDYTLTDERVVSMSYNDMWDENRAGILHIYDEQTGEVIGALTAQMDENLLHSGIVSTCLMQFFDLLSVIITAGFVVVELKQWLAAFRENRRLKRAHDPHPEIAMTHPFACLTVLASSVNGILLAVISSEIADRGGLAADGFLVSLPVMLHSIGYLIGGEMKPLFLEKLGMRRSLMLCAGVTAVGYSVDFWCVMDARLVPFAFSILVTSASVSVINGFATGLSFDVADDVRRVELNRSAAAAVIAGSSISGMLAGFLADRFGNAAVELLGLFFTVCLFIMFLVVIPKTASVGGAAEKKIRKERGGFKGSVIRLLKDGPTLGVLFFVSLPAEIAYGYRGYLFPLLATEAGMDKTLVSSIVVCCTAAAYHLSPLIGSAEKRLGSRRTLLPIAGIISAAFILFIVNRSTAWAIAVLAVTILGVKIIQPAVVSFWQHRANRNHVEHSIASGTAALFKYGGETVRSPVFAYSLDILGMTMTCFCTGVYFLISTGLFGLMLRIAGINAGRRKRRDT